MTSDKGLCGSIHSQLARATRTRIAEHPNTDVIAVGDKVKGQIARAYPENIVGSFASVGKDSPTFTEAAAIADTIVSLGTEYDSIEILYNKFVSGVAFEPASIPVFTTSAFEASPSSLPTKSKTRSLVTFLSTLLPTTSSGVWLRATLLKFLPEETPWITLPRTPLT